MWREGLRYSCSSGICPNLPLHCLQPLPCIPGSRRREATSLLSGIACLNKCSSVEVLSFGKKLGLRHFTKCLQTFRCRKLPTVKAEQLFLLGLLFLPKSDLGVGGAGCWLVRMDPRESPSWGSGLGNGAAVCLNSLSVIGII